MTINTSDNRYACSSFIVAPTVAEGANFTTIGAALAAASSGDTIFIKPGTYTEDLTLVAGVHITAFTGEGILPTVLIVGKASFADAGTVIITGIRLQTNSDFFLSVTGTSVSTAYLQDCFLDCTDNIGIDFSSDQGASAIHITDCLGDVGTTLITLVVSSGGGPVFFTDTTITNSGSTLLPSSCSVSEISLRGGTFFIPFSATGTAHISTFLTGITTTAVNITCIETAGTGASQMFSSSFDGGGSAAITVGSGTSVRMVGQNEVISAVADGFAITGAGTINYSLLCFPGFAKAINVANQAPLSCSNVLISAADTGKEISCQVLNSSDSASSDATVRTLVGGASGGDPVVSYRVTAVQDWIHGIDNSDSDKFVLSASSALGTTNVMEAFVTGEINFPLQPAFAATQDSSVFNATGDDTVYTLGTTVDLTEIFDQGEDFEPTTGVFTAPVTGRYQFLGNIWIIPGTGGYCSCHFFTTNRNWLCFVGNPNDMKETRVGAVGFAGHCFADMDALDTATFQIIQGDGTKTATIFGGANAGTWFSGNLET